MADEKDVAMSMEVREVVEKDTDEIEDVTNVFEFLLPPGTVPSDCSQFSLSYNKRVLDAWVRQPSACCGAASVAGAWNALANLHRSDKRALTHNSVLAVYRNMFVDMIVRKQASFERKLGSKMLPLLDLLKFELEKEGKTIGGKRAVAATKKSFYRILKRKAQERYRKTHHLDPPLASMEQEGSRDAIDCIVELLLLDGVDLNVPIPPPTYADSKDASHRAETKGAADDEEEYRVSTLGDLDDVDEDEDDEKDAEAEGGGGEESAKETKGRGQKGGGKQWDWLTDLMAIIKNIGGLKKICAARPSTALIGNWGILQGVERLGELSGLGSAVRARLYMGKAKTTKSKLDVSLARGDSAEVVKTQWDMLRAAFNWPHTVLLFHLKNHYALLHALREWTTADGSTVRQLLTARKGQRPTAWIDFSEAREQMLGWEGYKILLIEADEAAVRDGALACFDREKSLLPFEFDCDEVKSDSSSHLEGDFDEGKREYPQPNDTTKTLSLVSLSPENIALAKLFESL